MRGNQSPASSAPKNNHQILLLLLQAGNKVIKLANCVYAIFEQLIVLVVIQSCIVGHFLVYCFCGVHFRFETDHLADDAIYGDLNPKRQQLMKEVSGSHMTYDLYLFHLICLFISLIITFVDILLFYVCLAMLVPLKGEYELLKIVLFLDIGQKNFLRFSDLASIC